MAQLTFNAAFDPRSVHGHCQYQVALPLPILAWLPRCPWGWLQQLTAKVSFFVTSQPTSSAIRRATLHSEYTRGPLALSHKIIIDQSPVPLYLIAPLLTFVHCQEVYGHRQWLRPYTTLPTCDNSFLSFSVIAIIMIIICFRLYIRCCLRVSYEISCLEGPRHHSNSNYIIS